MNGYEELANAIILQAVKDYREALRLLGMNPNDKSAKRDQRNIERCGLYNSQGFFYAQGDEPHAQTTAATVFLPWLSQQM